MDGKVGFLVGAVATGIAVNWLRTRSQIYPLKALIDTDAMSYLAAKLPQGEDAFVWEAWDLIGRKVDYQGYGSFVELIDHSVRCQECLLPSELLRMEAPAGNCVAKAAALVSILRNRFPPQRVYMAIGHMLKDGVERGHAWAEWRASDLKWYVLEATMPPVQWMPLPQFESIYMPDALLNDQGSFCTSPERCLSVESCPCQG